MNIRLDTEKNQETQTSLENKNKNAAVTETVAKAVSAEWVDEEIKLLVKGVKGSLIYF